MIVKFRLILFGGFNDYSLIDKLFTLTLTDRAPIRTLIGRGGGAY